VDVRDVVFSAQVLDISELVHTNGLALVWGRSQVFHKNELAQFHNGLRWAQILVVLEV
jgi:hypothetical protein